MGDDTIYLYGDSTPSPLKTDFIAFLRDAFDFAVEVLLCDSRLNDAAQRVWQLNDATEREIERAEAFAAEVSRVLEHTNVGDKDSLAARCAARIRQSATDLVRSEAEAARTAVTTDRGRAEQTAIAERAACAKALETLLLRHALPDSIVATEVRFANGTHYDAVLHGATPYGLEWTLKLEVPSAHPFAQVHRVERSVARLEVEAPEEAGWIHKEIKIRPQRLDRLYLTELTLAPGDTTIRLRAGEDGSGPGFDLSFKQETERVELVRVVEGGAAPDAPYVVVGNDVAKLRSLHDGLLAMTRELMERKKSLITASLDGTSVKQLENPRVLVDRLVANIAPTVQQVSRRSLTPGELVLKRLLGENHREELFVSKAELYQKLEVLPALSRRTFEPFKLWEPAAPRHGSAPPAQEPVAAQAPAFGSAVSAGLTPGTDGLPSAAPPLGVATQAAQGSSRPPRP